MLIAHIIFRLPLYYIFIIPVGALLRQQISRGSRALQLFIFDLYNHGRNLLNFDKVGN